MPGSLHTYTLNCRFNILTNTYEPPIVNRPFSFYRLCKMTKQFAACNWVPSRITETQINEYVTTGALASKNVLHWRVPGPECPPEPQDGEVIVFLQHLARGFSPPGSKKFDMCLLASNSILKTLDQTPCPIFAISKYFVRLICKKNLLLSFSGISFT